MSLLPSVLDSTLESLVVIQTSLATPWLPFLHALLAPSPSIVICVSILHPPAVVLPAGFKLERHRVREIDWTANVPNYETTSPDGERESLHKAVLDAVASAPRGPVTLIVDSPDTLSTDMGSVSAAYAYLEQWYAALTARHSPARMILTLPSHSPLLPRVLTPAFSLALVHVTLHPPKLLQHLATEHLVPAPPHPRFWTLFSSARTGVQAEQLVWGEGGSGWIDAETVIEVLVRRPRGPRVERTIEGWRPAGPCELTELTALRDVWSTRSRDRSRAQAVDPTHDLSFNLVLTDAQQRARAQVPLPYAHAAENGVRNDVLPSPSPGTISYDPDSADDLDDDDPDEDLDI